ncbi:MAG: hypothetical protein GX130_07455 [Candidatus Hydrogenedens sp.]|jgi:hypothetical protein|nr:hypothetical protein [Candidatus Hydrogenedens sp.]
MSRSRDYKTQIIVPVPQMKAFAGNIKETPCMEIMAMALKKIAEEKGGTVTDSYTDCTGTKLPCILAIRTPALPRGIGVQVERNGKVSFIYDSEGVQPQEVEEICNGIARAYATIAVLRAQNTRGFRLCKETETPTSQGRRVTITAVKH